MASNFQCAKIKLDDLLQQFLRSEGSNLIALFKSSLTTATDGGSVEGKDTSSSWNGTPAISATGTSPSSPGAVPRSSGLNKKSPRKRPQSEMSASPALRAQPIADITSDLAKITTTETHSLPATSTEAVDIDQVHHRRRANFDSIPVFYVPGRKNCYKYRLIEDDKLVKRLSEIEAFFKPFPGGIPVEKFVHVTKRLCGIPSFFNLPLCKRINELYGDPDSGIPPPRIIGKNNRQPSGVKIKLKTFLKFWSAEIEPYDRIERFFNIIKQHQNEYIYSNDFTPFLQELLHFHPGLDFLEQHEEFQHKYALTVITRIFYKVNTSFSGKLSLAEVRHSNLFNACMHVDEETDINKVLDYFSYEHFYVLYCKFFELDNDKDSKIMKSDLFKYGDHALSETIVDR